jgi:hypothetical protein
METTLEINPLRSSFLTPHQSGSPEDMLSSGDVESEGRTIEFHVTQENSEENHSTVSFSGPELVVDNPYHIGLLVLRQKGMERLHSFVTEYQEGWGDGCGKPLRRETLDALFLFMAHAPINIGSNPSIFFTEDGSLELAWDDLKGNDVRVEFTEIGVFYHFAKTGKEGWFDRSKVQFFAENFESLE